MAKNVIEASEAVARGVELCRPGVIPMYPITPQTHIVERLADFINDGDLDSEMVHAESEHSAISIAIGAQAAGVRTFTATASQGLALMNEILFIASGMRLPIVMAIANRALSAPINIWNDHQDSISARDSGWIQIYVESAQEALDSVIMAYKVSESEDVLLPSMVCLDGFTLSHVYEPVEIPYQKSVDRFLPEYKPIGPVLDTSKPVSLGPIAFPDTFMEIKLDQHNAMLSALKRIVEANSQFKRIFRRGYGDGLIEKYRMEDAEYALICMGTVCGTTRFVVDEFRKKGKKFGMIKLKTFRPFPEKEIQEACSELNGLGVIDRSNSFGAESAVVTEVRACLRNFKFPINGFIAGLGGRDVKVEHIKRTFQSLHTQRKTEWLL